MPDDPDDSWGRGGIVAFGIDTFVGGAVLNPDGTLVVIDGTGVARLTPEGRVEAGFGGSIAGTPACVDVCVLQPLMRSADGRYLAGTLRIRGASREIGAIRFAQDGRVDATYGVDGFARAGEVLQSDTIAGYAVDEMGRVSVALNRDSGQEFAATLRRLDASGRLELVWGHPASSRRPPYRFGPLAAQAEGKLLVAAYPVSGEATLLRYEEGGRLDPTFGRAGMATIGVPGTAGITDIHVEPDGRIVVAGIRDGPSTSLFVARVDGSGVPDTRFGDGGVAQIGDPLAWTSMSPVVRVAVQPDGRIVVGRVGLLAQTAPFAELGVVVVHRLGVDGTPDPRFAGGGRTTIWSEWGSWLNSLLVRPDGRILVAANSLSAFDVVESGPPSYVTSVLPHWRPTLFQLRGGDLVGVHPYREATAIEFFHAGYGHYFVTTLPQEVMNLDMRPERGWDRTGQRFKVLEEAVADAVPVCRFWSGQSFAPKSSHVYTPYADECEKVKQDPVWSFEGLVFQLQMAKTAPGSRACAAGNRPLYRAYNDGKGGAPNHRYTTDPVVLDEMIAKGWIMEGEAATRVFACVPAPE